MTMEERDDKTRKRKPDDIYRDDDDLVSTQVEMTRPRRKNDK